MRASARLPYRGMPYKAFQIRMAENLKKYMEERNMTVYELCKKSKVPMAKIEAYLKTEVASPPLKHVHGLAHAFGISIGQLLK